MTIRNGVPNTEEGTRGTNKLEKKSKTMTTTTTTTTTKKDEGKPKFIGIRKQIEMKRHERYSKPRPWVERKMFIPVVMGIVGYTWYVYIGVICVPILRRDADALGGMAIGGEFFLGGDDLLVNWRC